MRLPGDCTRKERLGLVPASTSVFYLEAHTSRSRWNPRVKAKGLRLTTVPSVPFAHRHLFQFSSPVCCLMLPVTTCHVFSVRGSAFDLAFLALYYTFLTTTLGHDAVYHCILYTSMLVSLESCFLP